MDRRAYILPVISVFLVSILILRPDITGFMVAGPLETAISANISVSVNEGGFIPEDSIVTVYLDERDSSMGFRDFVDKTGKGFKRTKGEVQEIGYEGYGFGGAYTYVLDIGEFDLDTVLEPGNHTLVVEVIHGNYVISHTSQNIEV
jgi:hypothetical protein